MLKFFNFLKAVRKTQIQMAGSTRVFVVGVGMTKVNDAKFYSSTQTLFPIV